MTIQAIRTRAGAAVVVSVALLLGACGADDVTVAAVDHEEHVHGTAESSDGVPRDAWQGLLELHLHALSATFFPTLDEMAREADLVVLASLDGVVGTELVRPADADADPRHAVASSTVRLRVLEGSPDLEPGETVEVNAFGVTITEDLAKRTTEPALVFLHRRQDNGVFRLAGWQGLLVERSGTARMAMLELDPHRLDGAPADVAAARFGDGDQFDELVQRVRVTRAPT